MKSKAVVAAGQGGPEVLKLQDIDLAWPGGEHEVLVQLTAAALNPADIFFRQLGGYVASGKPFVLGHDGAGIVREIGRSVTSVKPGDRVCFCNGGIGDDPGTYAEAAVVPEWQLAEIPAAVDDLTAAALPLVGITAWEAIYGRAQTAMGETVLIHAGAGGTGHVSLQLAALRGARVAATVSSEAKAKLVGELGAERAVNYRETDFVADVSDWCRGGINVALDNVGAQVMQRTYRAMAPYGRIVTLMGTPGDDADLTAYNLNLTIHNLMMLTPMWKRLERRLKEQAEIVRKLLAMVAEGQLKIVHAATFPLSEAFKAHAFLESGDAVGKVTLQIRP
jgi:NADPH2:quinone reductase